MAIMSSYPFIIARLSLFYIGTVFRGRSHSTGEDIRQMERILRILDSLEELLVVIDSGESSLTDEIGIARKPEISAFLDAHCKLRRLRIVNCFERARLVRKICIVKDV